MIPYEEIENELYSRHSLLAFEYLLNNGREFTFTLNDKKIYISNFKVGGEVKYYLSISGDEKFLEFDTPSDLINSGSVDSRAFIDVWDEMELKILY